MFFFLEDTEFGKLAKELGSCYRIGNGIQGLWAITTKVLWISKSSSAFCRQIRRSTGIGVSIVLRERTPAGSVIAHLIVRTFTRACSTLPSDLSIRYLTQVTFSCKHAQMNVCDMLS